MLKRALLHLLKNAPPIGPAPKWHARLSSGPQFTEGPVLTKPPKTPSGLNIPIERRDFIHGSGLLGLGLGLESHALSSTEGVLHPSTYPPSLTGLRGSHPGSFEAAHAFARDGLALANPKQDVDHFDAVIVGAGISGLAAAHYYLQQFGNDKRILILDNHDDFGGHAKRNEFHQGGRLHLAIGGTHNLEYWQFSHTVNELMGLLGVDIKSLRAQSEFNYGRTGRHAHSIWFDRQTYGRDQLIKGCSLKGPPSASPLPYLDQFPISAAARQELRQFYEAKTDCLADMTADARSDFLHSTSYFHFLRDKGGLGDEALQLFAKACHGSWGLETACLSVAEALDEGLPGLNLVGESADESDWSYPAAFFPDGNASIARLLVAHLIPKITDQADATTIATAPFDYQYLDQPGHPVRIRLLSTVTDVRHTDQGVSTTYIAEGKPRQVRSTHVIMACYHSVIPYICPELPERQKQAQAYQIKYPLMLTNVLIRSRQPFDLLGIDGTTCPGRMHAGLFLMNGINTGGYRHHLTEPGATVVAFWGSLSPPSTAVDLRSQLRASRQRMLDLSFEDYEIEVREVLNGLLGNHGFDADRDILAITVNRWPHGYSHEYLDLWDDDYPAGQAPHEIARARYGQIAFANSDAGASAYTHTAIEEAFRAVTSLASST